MRSDYSNPAGESNPERQHNTTNGHASSGSSASHENQAPRGAARILDELSFFIASSDAATSPEEVVVAMDKIERLTWPKLDFHPEIVNGVLLAAKTDADAEEKLKMAAADAWQDCSIRAMADAAAQVGERLAQAAIDTTTGTIKEDEAWLAKLQPRITVPVRTSICIDTPQQRVQAACLVVFATITALWLIADFANVYQLARASGLPFTSHWFSAATFSLGFSLGPFFLLRYALLQSSAGELVWLRGSVKWGGLGLAIASTVTFGLSFGGLHQATETSGATAGLAEALAQQQLSAPMGWLVCGLLLTMAAGMAAGESFIVTAYDALIPKTSRLCPEFANVTARLASNLELRERWRLALGAAEGALRRLTANRKLFQASVVGQYHVRRSEADQAEERRRREEEFQIANLRRPPH